MRLTPALSAPHGAGQSRGMIRSALRAALAALLLSSPAFAAQGEAPPSPFDQALALREAARVSAEAQDWPTASALTREALAIQPGHPALLRNLLVIAQASGGDVFAALEAMATAGLTFEFGALDDPDGLQARDPERFAALEAAFAENAAPVGDARVRFTAHDMAGRLVEGLAVEIETERLFFGAVNPQEIRMAEPFSEGETLPVANAAGGSASAFGLAVDRRHQLLYAATGVLPQTPLEDGEALASTLAAYDLTSFEPVFRHEAPSGARLSDVLVRDGQVLAADGAGGRIFRLSGPGAPLELFFEDPRFASLQGIAAAQGAIFAADYALGVWRIDPGRRTAERLVSDGESLIGIDGLAAGPGGALYAVRNGISPPAVLKIIPAREGESRVEVVLRGHPAFEGGEPTSIRIADGRAFLLANSAWPAWGEDAAAPEIPGPAPVVLDWRLE